MTDFVIKKNLKHLFWIQGIQRQFEPSHCFFALLAGKPLTTRLQSFSQALRCCWSRAFNGD